VPSGGVHLGEALRRETPLLGPEGVKARRIAELGAGMRCVGCGERITIGIRFTRFDPVLREGRPAVDTIVTQACSRKDCNYAQETAPRADVMEMIEFAWLDEAAAKPGQPEGSARAAAVARTARSLRDKGEARRARAAAAG
jgi:hypothetical protein